MAFRWNIRAKLIVILISITVIPLLIVGMVGLNDEKDLGYNAYNSAKLMGNQSINALNKLIDISINDGKNALKDLAKEAIETRSQDIAKEIANFLYTVDRDARYLAELNNIDFNLSKIYYNFLNTHKIEVIYPEGKKRTYQYKEIAYLDLDGNAILKATIPGYNGKDFSLDDYKKHISNLKEGELFVSRLWGKALSKDVAYAGAENPDGKRYEGYYRWVSPVFKDGLKVGYVSLKVDARHIMEFTDHITPTSQRYVALPDARTGNYAYIVEDTGWVVSHPREYHLKGVYSDGTLTIPLDKSPGAPAPKEGTVPLKFGKLDWASKELNEIHTLHAINGESGSVIYPWAGLTKWVAYAPIPYHTGEFYNDKLGFGWVGVGAQIDKFQEPATQTEKKIRDIAEKVGKQTNEEVQAVLENIKRSTESVSTQNTILAITILAIIVAIIVGAYFASTISVPIRKLKEAADKVTDGDFNVELPHPKGNDEVVELTSSIEMLITALKMRLKQLATYSKAYKALKEKIKQKK
jgi:HAMP domain-containing protein